MVFGSDRHHAQSRRRLVQLQRHENISTPRSHCAARSEPGCRKYPSAGLPFDLCVGRGSRHEFVNARLIESCLVHGIDAETQILENLELAAWSITAYTACTACDV